MKQVQDQLTNGQAYILRAWIVEQGYAEIDQGWSYELNRQDKPTVAGTELVYDDTGSAAESTTGNSASLIPGILVSAIALLVVCM